MFGKNRRAVGSQLPCYIVVVLDGYRQAREPAGVIAILIFKVLSANAGARAQRLLWASTGSKDPKASDTLYVKALAAPFTINTMPENTLKAFADHGEVGELLAADGGDCERVLTSFAQAGVEVDALAANLCSLPLRGLRSSSGSLAKVHRHPPRLVARQPIWSPIGATQRYVRNRGRSGSARLALETMLMTPNGHWRRKGRSLKPALRSADAKAQHRGRLLN